MPVDMWGVCVGMTGVKVRVRRAKVAGCGSDNDLASFMGRGQQSRVFMPTASFKVSGVLPVGWAKGSRG